MLCPFGLVAQACMFSPPGRGQCGSLQFLETTRWKVLANPAPERSLSKSVHQVRVILGGNLHLFTKGRRQSFWPAAGSAQILLAL